MTAANFPMTGDVANYRILRETDKYILIQDIGPHDQYKTITNAAEWVVEQLIPRLKGRKLFYVDTDGLTDQLCYHCGKFCAFKAGGPDGTK